MGPSGPRAGYSCELLNQQPTGVAKKKGVAGLSQHANPCKPLGYISIGHTHQFVHFDSKGQNWGFLRRWVERSVVGMRNRAEWSGLVAVRETTRELCCQSETSWLRVPEEEAADAAGEGGAFPHRWRREDCRRGSPAIHRVQPRPLCEKGTQEEHQPRGQSSTYIVTW